MFLFCFLHIVFSNHIHLFPCLFSDAEEEEQGKEEVEKKERKYKHNPKVLNQRKGIYSCYYQLLKYSLLNVSLFYSEEDDVPEENVEVDWEEETQKRNPRRGTQEEEPKKRNPRRGTQEEEPKKRKKRNPRRGRRGTQEEEPAEEVWEVDPEEEESSEEEQEEEWEEDYQTNGKSAIAFVKRWIWLIHLLFTDGEKRQTENRNLKRNLQVKKKDKYETEGTFTNGTVCETTRIIDSPDLFNDFHLFLFLFSDWKKTQERTVMLMAIQRKTQHGNKQHWWGIKR